jgi:hypothetical protein
MSGAEEVVARRLTHRRRRASSPLQRLEIAEEEMG